MKKKLFILPLVALMAGCGDKGTNSMMASLPSGGTKVEENQKLDIKQNFGDAVESIDSDKLLISGSALANATVNVATDGYTVNASLNYSMNYKVAIDFENSALYGDNEIPSVYAEATNLTLLLNVNAMGYALNFALSNVTISAYLDAVEGNIYVDVSDPGIKTSIIALVNQIMPYLSMAGISFTAQQLDAMYTAIFGDGKLLIDIEDLISLLAAPTGPAPTKAVTAQIPDSLDDVIDLLEDGLEMLLEQLDIDFYSYPDGRYGFSVTVDNDTVEGFGVEIIDGVDFTTTLVVLIREVDEDYVLDSFQLSASVTADVEDVKVNAMVGLKLNIDYDEEKVDALALTADEKAEYTVDIISAISAFLG